jgi:hypothetical protein
VGFVAGCTRAVQIAEPTPDPRAADACGQFTAALPGELPTVGERREVTPTSSLTAAYGDPAVGVRCGVPDPAALGPTATLVTVEGIDWFAEELTAGWRMTTVDLVANVEITVGSEQGPAPSVAADLAPTIAATVPAGP